MLLQLHLVNLVSLTFPHVFINTTRLQDFASLGPSCTTSAEGICSLDVSTNYDSSTQSAVITAPGEGPLVVASLPSGYSSNAGAYAAVIVLDRQLVKPGDDLHLTGKLGCVLIY
eukprot:GHRQ01029672.1.p2 GENE.GHRQ01029672.1~~GHRQ01029672.1.p2  ORF type:complete len:114 (-),score=33.09 GHRQ01029672.1:925-1266(-)